MKKHLKNFIAGFVSTLIFHQGSLGLIFLAGLAPVMPYNTSPTYPLGVPVFLSLSFFGGLWGVLIGFLIRKDVSKVFWSKAIAFGAVGPTAVAFLVVFPLKGIALNPFMIPFGLFLNAMWGLGLGLLIRVLDRKPRL